MQITSKDSAKHDLSSGLVGQIAGYLGLIAVASYLCLPIFTSEIYLHLLVGRWIDAHGAVPNADFWTVAGLGKAWSPSSALFDLLCAQIETIAGDRGLIVLKLVLASLFLVLLADVYGSRSGKGLIGSVLALLVAAGSLVTYSFSAELFGWTLLALFCWASVGFIKLGGRRELISLVLITLLYASGHRGYPLAIVCLIPFLWDRSAEALHSGVNSRYQQWLGLVLAGLFLRLQPVEALHSLYRGVSRLILFEIPTRAHQPALLDYGVGLLLLIWILVLTTAISERHRLPLGQLLVGLIIAGLCSISREFTPYALMYTALLCAAVLNSEKLLEHELRPGVRQGFNRLASRIDRILAASPQGFAWVFFCLIFINVADLIRYPILTAAFPKHELDLVLERKLSFPLVNNLSDGAYIIHRLSDPQGNPRARAAVDERLAEIDPMLARSAYGVTDPEFSPEPLLQLVQPHTALLSRSDALFSLLSKQGAWRAVERNEPVPDPESRARFVPLQWAVLQAVDAS